MMSLKREFAQVTFQKDEVTAWASGLKPGSMSMLIIWWNKQQDNRQNQNLQFKSVPPLE